MRYLIIFGPWKEVLVSKHNFAIFIVALDECNFGCNFTLQQPHWPMHYIRKRIGLTSINSLRPSKAYTSILTIIGSDNGLSPDRQAIIWTNACLWLIIVINEIGSKTQQFSYKIMSLKMSSAKWWSFCLGPKMLNIIKGLRYHLNQYTYAYTFPRHFQSWQKNVYKTGKI